MKKRILLIGGACSELLMQVNEFANGEGEVREPIAYRLLPGGAVALGAAAVSRLGGEAILCSAVGDDAYGKELCAFFDDLGMDTRFIKTVKGEKTALDVTAENGEGVRRVYKSTALLSSIDAELVEDAFTTEPDAVYVSLDVPAEAAVRAAELAREKKIPSFFDGQRMAPDFPIEALGVIDLIALAPEMTMHLTGITPKDANSNLHAAVELHKRLRSRTYLFKHGIGGAFCYKGNFSYYIPYVEDADPRYAELIVPAMIVENLRSGKSVRAVRYASTVISVASRKGGIPILNVPTETEVLRYILEYDVELG